MTLKQCCTKGLIALYWVAFRNEYGCHIKSATVKSYTLRKLNILYFYTISKVYIKVFYSLGVSKLCKMTNIFYRFSPKDYLQIYI